MVSLTVKDEYPGNITRKNFSELIGIVIKGSERDCSRDHLLNAAGTTERTNIVKEIENVE